MRQCDSSTLGPLPLNPMDILRSVFTSRISSRFSLTAVWIIFFNLTTKGGAFVYQGRGGGGVRMSS